MRISATGEVLRWSCFRDLNSDVSTETGTDRLPFTCYLAIPPLILVVYLLMITRLSFLPEPDLFSRKTPTLDDPTLRKPMTHRVLSPVIPRRVIAYTFTTLHKSSFYHPAIVPLGPLACAHTYKIDPHTHTHSTTSESSSCPVNPRRFLSHPIRRSGWSKSWFGVNGREVRVAVLCLCDQSAGLCRVRRG